MTAQLLKQMVRTMGSPTPPAPATDQMEQQSGLQVELPFPVIIRGVDAAQRKFEEQTVLNSLSASSLSLTLSRQIEVGATLFLVVWLSIEPIDLVPAPRVAFCGRAQRVEPQSGGTCSLAVAVSCYRFLYNNGH